MPPVAALRSHTLLTRYNNMRLFMFGGVWKPHRMYLRFREGAPHIQYGQPFEVKLLCSFCAVLSSFDKTTLFFSSLVLLDVCSLAHYLIACFRIAVAHVIVRCQLIDMGTWCTVGHGKQPFYRTACAACHKESVASHDHLAREVQPPMVPGCLYGTFPSLCALQQDAC